MKTTALLSMSDAVRIKSIETSLRCDDTESYNKEIGKSISVAKSEVTLTN